MTSILCTTAEQCVYAAFITGRRGLIVDTVVIVRLMLGLGQREVALTQAASGGGSKLAAFILPRLLDRLSDRKVMPFAATVLSVSLGAMFTSGFTT